MPRLYKSSVIPFTVAAIALAVFQACGSSSDSSSGPAPTVANIALTVSSPDSMVSLGDTRTVTAVATDASAATIASPNITWTSSAPAVASVTTNGTSATVTAVGNGTATITASSGSVQSTVTVKVLQRAIAIGLTGAPTTMAPGAAAQIAAQAQDAKTRAVAGVTGFTFASSNEAVAVIGATGLVTAISPGSATITSTVTVNGVPLQGTASLNVAFATATPAPSSGSVNATDNNTFSAPTVTIATGGSVTWAFATVVHNVTFSAAAGVPTDIGNTSGTSVTRTFGTAGTFTYQCTLHSGMTGSVVVQPASSAPGFTAILNGANERPTAVTTTGAGAASFTLNGSTMSYVVTFSRLSGVPIMSHIHAPGNASQAVAVLVDFPTTGQTANNGVLTGTFTAAAIRNTAISMDSLLVLMRNGNAYVNVHTTLNPAGEIRGQIGTP